LDLPDQLLQIAVVGLDGIVPVLDLPIQLDGSNNLAVSGSI
jgi:hypothetical protein